MYYSCTAKLSSPIYPPRSVRSFDGSDGVFEPNGLRGGGGDSAAWGAAEILISHGGPAATLAVRACTPPLLARRPTGR